MIKTKGLVRSYNAADCDASINIYIMDNSDTNILITRQFISKTRSFIKYYIYVINISKQDVRNIKLVDYIPKDAELYSVTIDNGSSTVDGKSIYFNIPLIKPELYSKIIINIKNNIKDEEDNSINILGWEQ